MKIRFVLSGNEVDQSFSVVAQELKHQPIHTVEALKVKIEGSPLKPHPTVEFLDYVFDWKKFITPHLSDPQLTNHTRYNGFLFTREDNLAVLR